MAASTVPSSGHSPGRVFVLDPRSNHLDDPDYHPHVLLTACAPGTNGTLCYGSTKAAEKANDAPCLPVRPQRGGVNHNGLRYDTFFYPGVLVREKYEELPATNAHIIRKLDELRVYLVDALGLGSGPCSMRNGTTRSWRGRIVELEEGYQGKNSPKYGVIVTCHAYSVNQQYQTIIPIAPGAGQTGSTPFVVRVERRPWLRVFGDRVTAARIPVALIHAVRHLSSKGHRAHIGRYTGVDVDETTMAEIDEMLRQFFSLKAGCVSRAEANTIRRSASRQRGRVRRVR